MGEGTHTTPVETGTQAGQPGSPAKTNQKWLLLIGGTVGAMVIAGILFQIFRPISGQAQEKLPAPAVGKATVGDGLTAERYLGRVTLEGKSELITWDEVAHECMLRYGEEILENIINRKIIELACNAQGANVSEAEVDQEITKISQKFGMSVEQWHQMLVAERNVTPAQYRRDIIWPMLALKKLAGGDVKITKEEMRRAFVHNYGERVKARVIVMDNPRRAAEVWEAAQANPADFNKLVREHSIDPGSRPLDGSVPPIRRYSRNPASEPLEEAAFKLREGEISPVVQVGPNQWIILLCEGRTEPIVSDPKEVQRELYDDLKESKIQESVATVFERLKKEARVDNHLLGQTTGGAAASASGVVKQVGASSPVSTTRRPATSARQTPPTRRN